jgi:hypothetical protein
LDFLIYSYYITWNFSELHSFFSSLLVTMALHPYAGDKKTLMALTISGTKQVCGERVSVDMRVNVFSDPRPDTCLRHHGPEIAGVDGLAVFPGRHKVFGVYCLARIFPDKVYSDIRKLFRTNKIFPKAG